ncbi:MBL fold metallo-hydrolase [Brevibacillus sp. 179-C9.3 HS]|uniref:MBL fold metallo-hydrolase n=1 Tax=unclassified Brevibacillus TaxID=2684853 RepID=UPI00399EF3C7
MNEKIAKISLPTTFQSEGVNVFVLEGDSLTLVDAGQNVEGSWYAFTEQLKFHGYTVKDIKQIIITHHHVDHIGLVKYFDHDVTFIGHPDCERWVNPPSVFLEEHDAFFHEFFHQLGVPDQLAKPYIHQKNQNIIANSQRSLDLHVVEGSELPGLSEWRIIETFGHSQGHLSLFHPDDQLLIGGDILLPRISPNPIIEPPISPVLKRQTPQIQLNDTLRKLLQLDIQRVLPGHGEDITELLPFIHSRLKKQHERAMQVREWLKKESLTAYEVSRRLFPDSYKSSLGLILFETIGQLDYLLSLRFITEERSEKGITYSANPTFQT